MTSGAKPYLLSSSHGVRFHFGCNPFNAARCFPSAVLGPVDNPPCSRHRARKPYKVTAFTECPSPRLRTAGQVAAYLGEGWPLCQHGLLGRMLGQQATAQYTPGAHQDAQRQRLLVLKEVFPAVLPLVTGFDPGTPSTAG